MYVSVLCSVGPAAPPSGRSGQCTSVRLVAGCGSHVVCVPRPTLLLENYQPWLDLKVHSKVDASIAEVLKLRGFTSEMLL